MKRPGRMLTRCVFLGVIVLASAVAAQDDIEDPSSFEGVWYRLALDEDGAYVLGDGDGYAGGTWYYYPQSKEQGWFRHWFYNDPYDPNRKGQLDYVVYIRAVDVTEPTSVEVRFNWTTPAWSALGKRRPPLPSDVSTADLEAKYMQSRDLQRVNNWFIGTIEPIKSHTIWDYNPEWVSIDIRGKNAYVYRGAYHYCRPKDPAMGACYDMASGDCYTGYEGDCEAPYVWLGAGSSCSDYLVPEPFPIPVYRFWSAARRTHFYTTSEREKDSFLTEPEDVCAFEGIAYCAFMDGTDPKSRPVYRFWSDKLGVYFYTIVESEKTWLEAVHSHVWSYEGPAFYAYPEGKQPSSTVPVYRFWSADLGYHFYTIDEGERDKLIDEYPFVWAYEGIAWYAYAP